MNKLFILVLLLAPLKATADTHSHSLWMMVTLIKGDTPFPEFSGVALLDDIVIGYYDTNDNELLYRGINNSDTQPDTSKINYISPFVGRVYGRMSTRADYLRNYLNHTNNVFVFQRASGCELLENNQPGDLMSRDAVNGESGIARHYSSQLHTLQTHRAWPKAVETIWPDNYHFLYEHIYHPNCISLLKTLLVSEKNRILKKVKPKVRLLQKQDPGSTVLLTCLATGFYPRHINLTLHRGGQPVPDHQISGGELLPNGDETYQMRKSLEVSTEELQQHHYTCTVQHLSLDNKLDVNLDHKWDSVTTSIVSTVLVAAFVCLGGLVGLVFFICWRKRNGATATSEAEVSYSPASSTEDMDKGITSGKAEL